MKDIVIRKKKLIYLLKEDSVTVYVGLNQWISYNQYNNWNRKGITQFRQKIIESKIDQYDTATDQMSLAYECDIKGVNTIKPKEIDIDD